MRSCCWSRSAPLGIVRLRGVRGGGWKGEAVRRGVKTSGDDQEVEEGISEAILGSVRRLYSPETTWLTG